MDEPDLIELFVRPLHERGMKYLVAGSLGSMLYSEPRLTLDIDLAVALNPDELNALPACFPAPDYYCPPFEVLAAENERECRGHFNVIHVPSGFKADFYPSRRDAFFAWAWRSRHEVALSAGAVNYAPPEYVIVWKTAYYAEGGGEKHVRDIRRMLDVSGGQIDRKILSGELARRCLTEAFRQIEAA